MLLLLSLLHLHPHAARDLLYLNRIRDLEETVERLQTSPRDRGCGFRRCRISSSAEEEGFEVELEPPRPLEATPRRLLLDAVQGAEKPTPRLLWTSFGRFLGRTVFGDARMLCAICSGSLWD